jgi:hypothetical protein
MYIGLKYACNIFSKRGRKKICVQEENLAENVTGKYIFSWNAELSSAKSFPTFPPLLSRQREREIIGSDFYEWVIKRLKLRSPYPPNSSLFYFSLRIVN